MTALDGLVTVLLVLSVGFFVAGTVALVRFPDVFCRLHALTKADNVGLGFLCLALVLRAPTATDAFKLVALWLMVLVASSAVSFLVAHGAYQRGGGRYHRP